MSITIIYPPSGTATQPSVLPRRFIAVGRKPSASAKVVGFLIGQNNELRIGGETLKYGRDNEDPDRWAIYFRVPRHIRSTRHFTLAVFDGQDLPGPLTDVSTTRVEHLSFRVEPRGIESTKQIEFPITPGPASRNDFFAFGFLPGTNNDVDDGEEQTVVINRDDRSQTKSSTWVHTDGEGFWAAFFPPLTDFGDVDLTVIYLPLGTHETEESIELE